MLPARIKNGIAIRVNTEMPENVLCAPVKNAALVSRTGNIATIEEIPMAIAIGAPIRSIISNTTAMIKPQKRAVLIYSPSFKISTIFKTAYKAVINPLKGTIT